MSRQTIFFVVPEHCVYSLWNYANTPFFVVVRQKGIKREYQVVLIDSEYNELLLVENLINALDYSVLSTVNTETQTTHK